MLTPEWVAPSKFVNIGPIFTPHNQGFFSDSFDFSAETMVSDEYFHIFMMKQMQFIDCKLANTCVGYLVVHNAPIAVYANYIGPSVMTDANCEGFPICDDRITENDRCVIKIIGIHCDCIQTCLTYMQIRATSYMGMHSASFTSQLVTHKSRLKSDFFQPFECSE